MQEKLTVAVQSGHASRSAGLLGARDREVRVRLVTAAQVAPDHDAARLVRGQHGLYGSEKAGNVLGRDQSVQHQLKSDPWLLEVPSPLADGGQLSGYPVVSHGVPRP